MWSKSGRPNRKTQLSTISFATSGASVPFSGTLNTYFVNKSVITNMCLAQVSLAIVTGHRISAADVGNRIPTLNDTSPPILLLPGVVLAAHCRHQASFFSRSCLMCGHQKQWWFSFPAIPSPVENALLHSEFVRPRPVCQLFGPMLHCFLSRH